MTIRKRRTAREKSIATIKLGVFLWAIAALVCAALFFFVPVVEFQVIGACLFPVMVVLHSIYFAAWCIVDALTPEPPVAD